MRIRARRTLATTLAAAVTTACLVATTTGATPVGAATSSATSAAGSTAEFYRYTGATPLADIAPGTVLKTRTVPYHLGSLATPLQVVQLLFRTTDQLGRPSVAVTSVLKSPVAATTDRVISYQSFYDSLNPADSPSYAIAGDAGFGGFTSGVETGLVLPFLLQGYDIVVADTEGATADFAAGPEYGRVTLDSLRATLHSPATGVAPTSRVGLVGYSGGAIATNWAAALMRSYAPELQRQVVGAASGGVLVEPAHNLHYIDGSLVWAGVIVMALIGVARANDVDLTPYLNPYGVSLYRSLQTAPIFDVLGHYPGLTWAKLAKPQYAQPESVPLYVRLVNKLNLGTAPTPRVPLFLGQGANGVLEGTSGSTPGIGAGDGVMIAGDVRSLARTYCAAGATVDYRQYDLTSHFTTVALWLPDATAWLSSRFAGTPAPNNCAGIAPGNPLTPVTVSR